MRKLISIPLIILALFSGISVSIATHYCNGNAAGSKVSFSGEVAGCGMENTSPAKSDGLYFSRHCCENVQSAFSYNANYFPVIQVIGDPGITLINSVFIPAGITCQHGLFTSPEVIARPPGIPGPSGVSLEEIHILRI